MKKRISAVIAFVFVIIFCFSLSACSASAGKSAYEIALDNGFTGTEQEWLDSLVGQDGKDAQSNIDIYDLYDAYLESYPLATFEEFLQQFLTINYYDTEYAAAKGIQSAVSVYSTFTRRSPRPGQSSEYSSGGAGIVYKTEGGYAYIITNYHVIYDRDSAAANRIAHTIEAYAYGFESTGNGIPAEFIGGSITKDIAVIKAELSAFPDGIKAVKTADSNEITLGERVVAIGNPLAEGIAITSGVISIDSEEIQMEALDSESGTVTVRVMRTDASINSGNSGGGLFNTRGELVGIVNAKTVESGVENMGYAIPVNVAAGIADCVMENDAKKCVLGITISAVTSTTQFNSSANRVEIIESLTIEEITSSLSQGKLAVGDKILSASINDGEEFHLLRIFHLPDFLYNMRVGDTLHLKIERDGQIMSVSLTPSAENFSPV